MCENGGYVAPVNALTLFARTLFSWVTRHITMCLYTVHSVFMHQAISQGRAV